jgi:hypothetical protein
MCCKESPTLRSHTVKSLLLLIMVCAGLLTSCSTTTTTDSAGAGFKFWVLRYNTPVDATLWVPDGTLSGDPEAAALNIAAAMKRGDVAEWLANWESGERPHLDPARTEALLRDWHSLEGAKVSILGRVVAEADVIVELSVGGSSGTAGKIQIPLRRANDRWWLTAMDSSSEYLHWENSPNKLIQYIDPDTFAKHLRMLSVKRG